MKKFINLILCFFILIPLSMAGGGDASTLTYFKPDARSYLTSVQKLLINDVQWRSYDNLSLSTATYNASTETVYITADLVDTNDNLLRAFTSSVGTVSFTTAGTGSGGATLTTATLVLTGGSVGFGLTLTGTWSIGNTITVSFPGISLGGLSASSSTRILTFSE